MKMDIWSFKCNQIPLSSPCTHVEIGILFGRNQLGQHSKSYYNYMLLLISHFIDMDMQYGCILNQLNQVYTIINKSSSRKTKTKPNGQFLRFLYFYMLTNLILSWVKNKIYYM